MSKKEMAEIVKNLALAKLGLTVSVSRLMKYKERDLLVARAALLHGSRPRIFKNLANTERVTTPESRRIIKDPWWLY